MQKKWHICKEWSEEHYVSSLSSGVETPSPSRTLSESLTNMVARMVQQPTP